MPISFTFNRRLVIVGVGFLAIFALAVAWLFSSVYIFQNEDPVTRSLSAWLRIPAARVGSHIVTYDEYVAHKDSLKTFLEGPLAVADGLGGTIGPDEKQSALDRAIRLTAIEEAAKTADIVATSLDVERAYDGLIAQNGTSTTPGEIRDFLRDQFGWNEADFKRYVVRPALLEDALSAKRTRETQDESAFERELDERLQQADVVTYLRFN
jgi:hypothetical protein